MSEVPVHFFVEGRVQGVGFRYFVGNLAEHFHLSGWVRNTSDGRVEVLASGEPDVIPSFLAAVEKGPLFARVDQLKHEPITQKTPPMRQGVFERLK